MKVLDVLSVIDPNTNTILVNNDTQSVEAIYDGKDSIPEKYNEWDVNFITTEAISLPITKKEVVALAIYAHK